MFAKNVFGSRLDSIICKTINVRACALRASPAGRLHPSTPHPPIYIGGGGVGCEGLCGGSIVGWLDVGYPLTSLISAFIQSAEC